MPRECWKKSPGKTPLNKVPRLRHLRPPLSNKGGQIKLTMSPDKRQRRAIDSNHGLRGSLLHDHLRGLASTSLDLTVRSKPLLDVLLPTAVSCHVDAGQQLP